MPQETIRVGAAAIILCDGGIVLGIRKKAGNKGKRVFPGGKIHRGETAEAAMRREIREETGITNLLTVQSIGFVESLPSDDDETHRIIIVFLVCTQERPLSQPQSDLSDPRVFPLQELPENISPLCKKMLKLYNGEG